MPLTVPEPTTPHKVDSFSESWPSGQPPRAQVVYACDWDDHYALVRELMGGYPSGAVGFSSYTPPMRYPPSPNLFCEEISSIEGRGRKKPGSKWSPYTDALITAIFSIPSIDYSAPSLAGQIDPDPANAILFCRQRIRASSAFKVLPKKKIKFSTSGKLVETEVARPAAQSEITLEYPRVPFNPYFVCKPYIGKTNKHTILGHTPGTLLLDSLDTDESASSDGSDCGATLTFLGRDADWNTLVNEDGNDELIEYAITPAPSTPKRPFQQVDFFTLLR